MEVGVVADGVGLLRELEAAFFDSMIEVFERLEGAIGDGLVGEWPEAFGGLQLGAVGRQVFDVDAAGNLELLGAVPAGVVDGEDDDAVLSGADRLGEQAQAFVHHLGIDRIGQQPLDLAGLGLDVGVEIEPLIAGTGTGLGALSLGRPDPPDDRFQAEAMLVERPGLDRLVGVLLLERGNPACEFFLKPACSSALARPSCAGRGTCRLSPSFFR